MVKIIIEIGIIAIGLIIAKKILIVELNNIKYDIIETVLTHDKDFTEYLIKKDNYIRELQGELSNPESEWGKELINRFKKIIEEDKKKTKEK